MLRWVGSEEHKMFCGVTSGFKNMLRKTKYKLNVNLIRNLSQIMDAEKATGQKTDQSQSAHANQQKLAALGEKYTKH